MKRLFRNPFLLISVVAILFIVFVNFFGIPGLNSQADFYALVNPFIKRCVAEIKTRSQEESSEICNAIFQGNNRILNYEIKKNGQDFYLKVNLSNKSFAFFDSKTNQYTIKNQ
jgi:hypothetical protein